MKPTYIVSGIILIGTSLFFSSCSSKKSAYSDDIMYSDNYSATKLSSVNAVPESGKILTRDEAIRIALANNPQIQIAKLQAIAANAQYYGSFAALTPGVNAGAGIVKSTGSPVASAAGISGSMNVWNGLTSQMNVLAAKSNAMSAEEMNRNARRLLAEQTAFIYDSIIADKVNIKIQMDNKAFWENELKKIQRVKNPGKKAIADALQMKVYADMAHSAVIKNIENFNNDKFALATMMGMSNAKLPSNTLFPDAPHPSDEPKDMPNVNSYLDQAVNQRPDLYSAKDNVNAANYNLYAAYGELSPSVDAGVAAAAANINSQNVNFTAAGAAANANLNPVAPITNIVNAQAQKDIAKEQLVQTYTQSMADVRTSYNNLASDYAQNKILRAQESDALQSRNLVTERYNDGKTSIADLTQAQNFLVNTQLEYYKTAIEIEKSKAALDAAIGISQ
ncbi:MAG TPA: hypothetical protein DD381_04770 [Lentisphaeria bacterium]|nr:MAG: hypothetical protein A2X47_01680 [Lentisphaerae bacterium GWF2_38_69]HBM15644.1 hypothetical protein [Lentisphaeria bacterium]